MSWFENLIPSRIRTDSNTAKKKNIPEGLWTQCKNCHSALYRAEVERNLEVCPKCHHHMRISARKRIEKLLDKGSMVELDANLKPVDILKFKDLKRYKDRFTAAQNSTKEHDALITAQGTIHGLPIVAGAFEFNFMGGSMGSVVGEKFVRAVNVAIEQQSALVIYSASGGARMQEALFSLMQMAKTSAALTRLADQNLPFISVLTDPTMGGVSASFATLGDIIIAEPNALIGFAGPRVIEQTVRETLPEGFQRSEFLLEKGSVDKIINRLNMRSELADLLCIMLNKPRPETIHEEAMRQQELQNRDLSSDANKPE